MDCAMGFLLGRTLELHKITSNPLIMARIAQVMAKLHSLPVPDHFKEHEPILWSKTSQLLKSVPASFSDPDAQRLFAATIGSIGNLLKEIDFVKSLLKECCSPVVLCHNDVHSANIIYHEETDSIKLVDYEFAGPNYAAFDIANHFCKFAGVHSVDYSRYPDERVQKTWLRVYLEEVQKLKQGNTHKALIDKDAVHHLYCEVNKMALGSHLLWIVWALFQAANSAIKFDFMEYATLKYSEYLKRKVKLYSM